MHDFIAKSKVGWGSWKLFELSGSRLSPICGCSWTRWGTRFGFWIIATVSTSGTCAFPDSGHKHASPSSLRL